MEKMAFQLPDKPSIAVLPFTNMSGDPEQDYFSEGITEDIITALSKINNLLVIASNSTANYMVAQAVPSVSPSEAAAYLQKVDCFCSILLLFYQ